MNSLRRGSVSGRERSLVNRWRMSRIHAGRSWSMMATNMRPEDGFPVRRDVKHLYIPRHAHYVPVPLAIVGGTARPRCPAEEAQERTMPVKQFAPTYDAAVLSVLEQAYSAACREIDIDPHPSDSALNRDVREALAK